MKRQPQRTPLADIENTGVSKGRRVLAARYPSASEPGKRHTLDLLDDGTVLQCSCHGWQTHGHCWHANDAPQTVSEYHRRTRWRDRAETIARDISSLELYLTHPLDEAERNAGELELIGLRSVAAGRRETAA